MTYHGFTITFCSIYLCRFFFTYHPWTLYHRTVKASGALCEIGQGGDVGVTFESLLCWLLVTVVVVGWYGCWMMLDDVVVVVVGLLLLPFLSTHVYLSSCKLAFDQVLILVLFVACHWYVTCWRLVSSWWWWVSSEICLLKFIQF